MCIVAFHIQYLKKRFHKVYKSFSAYINKNTVYFLKLFITLKTKIVSQTIYKTCMGFYLFVYFIDVLRRLQEYSAPTVGGNRAELRGNRWTFAPCWQTFRYTARKEVRIVAKFELNSCCMVGLEAAGFWRPANVLIFPVTVVLWALDTYFSLPMAPRVLSSQQPSLYGLTAAMAAYTHA